VCMSVCICVCVYVCVGAGQEVEFNMAAPIMMVLDGCSSNRDHLLVANTLMQLKRNVCLVRAGKGYSQGREGEGVWSREGVIRRRVWSGEESG